MRDDSDYDAVYDKLVQSASRVECGRRHFEELSPTSDASNCNWWVGVNEHGSKQRSQ